jgi:hypothetical protein
VSIPDNAAVQSLLTRAGRLVGSLGGGQLRELPRHYLEILALFDRCRSLLGAVQLLLRSGFPEEAMMLGRPLLTDSLALAELAAADEKRRAELAIGWELATIADLRGANLEGKAQGHDVEEQLSGLDRYRAWWEEYASSRGLHPKHWQPDADAKRLATRHGREDEYLDLRMLHHFVHGSTFATAQRYSTRDGLVVMVGGPAAKEEWAYAAGGSAAQSALYAARAICTILEIDEPPELAALIAEVDAMAEQAKAA